MVDHVPLALQEQDVAMQHLTMQPYGVLPWIDNAVSGTRDDRHRKLDAAIATTQGGSRRNHQSSLFGTCPDLAGPQHHRSGHPGLEPLWHWGGPKQFSNELGQ